MIKKILQYILVFFTIQSYAQTTIQLADIQTVYDRVAPGFYNTAYKDLDIQSYVTNLSAQGTWPDINYTVTQTTIEAYSPVLHNTRIKQMCAAYAKQTGTYYLNANLLQKIKLALNNNLGRPHTQYFNWDHDWYQTYISSPSEYSIALFIIQKYLSSAEFETYNAHLRDGLTVLGSDKKTFQFEFKGQNTVWVANVAINKGLMEKNWDRINNAYGFISRTMNLQNTQGGEGIKSDGAFHQHDAQLYSGGYGLWIISDWVTSLNRSKGTGFYTNFSADKMQNISNVLLGGHRWFTYKSVMDYGSLGRNISRSGEYEKSSVSDWVLNDMATIDAVNASKYTAWKAHKTGAASGVVGVKQFWQTDMIVARGLQSYMSVKIPTVRTNGTETMNTENLKGFYLAVGATNVLTTANEYKTIFPTWDWSRIPGTTSELGVTYPSAHTFKANNTFGGSVNSNSNGVIAFSATYNGVSHKKAYFFINNVMYCMGAGIIASKTNPIVTSVEQNNSNGIVTINNSVSSSFNASEQSFTNLKWVYHDGKGYIFPKQATIVCKNDTQSGTWFDINNLIFPNKNIVSKKVFSLWFNHGANPQNAKYEYIVVPEKTLAEIESLAQNHGFVVAQNDTLIQAVSNSNVYATVFYKAGTIVFNDGFQITADKEAFVLIEKKDNGYYLYVSDPNHTQTTVKISINKNVTAQNAVYNATTKKTDISITYPLGVYRGKSVEVELTNVPNIPPVVEITTPISNSQYSAPASIIINANATDTDGTIDKVEFFNGITLLGSDATAPYSFEWTNVVAGTYAITVKATDNEGAVSTSSAIDVTVVEPIVPWVNTQINAIKSLQKCIVSVSPSKNNSDALFGFSPNQSTMFDSLACIVRFNATGTIDVRNGATYTALNIIPYVAGEKYTFELTIDIENHVYSVAIIAQNNTIPLAINAAFRLSQTKCVSLNYFVEYEQNQKLENVTYNFCPQIQSVIVLPQNTITYGDNLSVKVLATDLDGALQSVDLYLDSKLVRTEYTAPYEWNSLSIADVGLKNIVPGIHELTAKVTDNNGSIATISKTVIVLQSQSILLQKGWNLISTNVYVADSSIEKLFANLDVEMVKDMQGFWKKGQDSALNSLHTITAGEGYLVYMNAAGALTVSGTPMLFSNFQIGTSSNWYLIGCPFQTTTPFSNYFNTTNCQTIKNFDGFWVPNGTLNSIQNFEPGKGYCIKK